jgi:hypothetical protein
MALAVDQLMDEMLEYFVEEGNLATGALVDWTGKTRATVTGRLNRLRAADCIEYVHEPTGLHRLTEDPREEEDAG